MPTDLPPHRSSHAVVSARSSLIFFNGRRRFVALILIALLSFPAVLVRPRQADANGVGLTAKDALHNSDIWNNVLRRYCGRR